MFEQHKKGCLRTVTALCVAVVLLATTSGAVEERTALQKHGVFFDINGDNYLSPGENYKRMKQLGLSSSTATFFTITFGLLGPLTNPKWYAPFSINLKYIIRARNAGGATMILRGPNGGVDEELKESKFLLFDVDEDGTLSTSEVKAMVKATQSYLGRVRLNGEFFGLLFPVAAEDRVLLDGSTEQFVTKDSWDDFFDGSLLFYLVGETPPWEQE
jgi:hypothetical protein